MKVLLKEDVDNLGYAGDITKVANGFGRNYLIPRGLAVKATPSVLKEARAWRERAAVRRAELQAEYEALAEQIINVNLNFYAKAGESGKLYGSVTTNDVADELNRVLGTDIDRRKIVGQPLRQLGPHQVTVRLSREVQPQINLVIHPEQDDSDETEAAAEEEAAAETEASAEEAVEEAAVEESVETAAEEAEEDVAEVDLEATAATEDSQENAAEA